MADILIGDVDDRTMELLRRRAQRHGHSLETFLLEALKGLAQDETAALDDAQPFGSWLYALSRPGVDLEEGLHWLSKTWNTSVFTDS
ncbi:MULTISPECIES: FitA-like ribbon-helix-helix domain-containing protein [unclassified Bradyrhizobium]|uniref:FitA-like ribbon-helix-helix domain-containing protein n=1 Tax=unclassified Bradyrhizobium TaxID=2631580 RepID=UPI0028EBA92B|nr:MULTISPECIES: plasmid stability protein y4jJ [unclassified Bradyrhizobium]